jgi:hypothetical protein
VLFYLSGDDEMHIAVVIPKGEYENDERETAHMQEEDLVQFWTLSTVPKRLQEGDRVYFIKQGRIESSMRVIKVVEKSRTKCETTGRTWYGACQVFMDDLREEYFDFDAKAFQGFAYMDNLLAKYVHNP